MEFPLLLAGPILRRVEPAVVSVWLALREKANVRLLVWEGRAETGRNDAFLRSPDTATLRVGEKLHLAEVTIEIPATAGKSLQADALYSYDVEITIGRDVHTLGSLGMLEDGAADRATDGDDDFRGRARLALGFEPGLLPSFAPPPSDLAHLNILYGSCRRPHHPDPDALAMVDELIFGDDRYKDPRARPHQLFLGGDQIYADDVAAMHMLLVMERAVHLIGALPIQPPPPFEDPRKVAPVEHVQLDRIAERRAGADVDPADPAASYVETNASAPTDLPVDRLHFPEGRRRSTIIRDAQMTTSDGGSHVISLGEFAALHLTVWSNALWGIDLVGARFEDAAPPQENWPILWQDDEDLPEGRILMPAVGFPDRIAGSFYVAPKEPPKTPTAEEAAEAEALRQRGLRRQLRTLRAFHKGLPKVQRVLANVPTYMIFDDHDATDDFFLNPMWRDRVLGSRLGQDIMRNAMTAYALFQDWGNVPLDYRSGPKAELLSLAGRLFPEAADKGPDRPPAERLAQLFGHDLRNEPTPDGRYAAVSPPIRWHFTVDGPRHRAIVLDNRTRRSYLSRNGPPGNVSVEAMLDQIPAPPLPAGREILVVVAPLQVFGPPVLDEFIAPLAYRAFDLKGLSSGAETSTKSDTGLRGMLGTNPDAIEAWSFDAVTFEHLLERLEPYGRVVILSGDVHYSASSLMSYWRGAAARPARFAQFTSSGLKNVMPAYIAVVDRSIGLAQQMVRANLGTERIAWDRPLPELVLLPDGTSEFDLTPVMRARLESTPVLIPSWGWPETDPDNPTAPAERTSRLNPALPPDWRWRVRTLLDSRPDAERPAAMRLMPIDDAAVEADLRDQTTVLEGYQVIARRHQFALERLRNARQFLFRANVGRVTFRKHADGRLDAVHELFTTSPAEIGELEPKPEPVMVHVAPLGPEDEAPPARLRARAIEPFRPEVA